MPTQSPAQDHDPRRAGSLSVAGEAVTANLRTYLVGVEDYGLGPRGGRKLFAYLREYSIETACVHQVRARTGDEAREIAMDEHEMQCGVTGRSK